MSAEPPPSPSSSPSSSRSELPVPWQNPWGLLVADLRAALAWLRLKARELIRRNREGEFAVPSFWPAALRPAFWPLLLATIALLLLALPVLLLRSPAEPPSPAAGRPLAPLAGPAVPDVAAPGALAPDAAAPGALAPGAVPQEATGLAPTAEAAAGAAGPRSSPPVPLPPPDSLSPAALDSAQRSEPDPLLLQLRQAGGEAWIEALVRCPARAAIELSLKAGWLALSSEQRQRLAEAWLQLVREDGWEALLLSDAQGRELGRPAAVGSGMILLDPSTL